MGAMRDRSHYELSEQCMFMVTTLLEGSLDDGHDLTAIHMNKIIK